MAHVEQTHTRHHRVQSTFESVGGGGGVEAGLTRFWYGSQKCEWEGEEVSEKTTPYGKSGPWTPETPRPTLCK